jgi:hypothetical protein
VFSKSEQQSYKRKKNPHDNQCLLFELESDRHTLRAENKAHDDSAKGVESFVARGTWCCNSMEPFEKWGGEDVGNVEPDEKATG